MVLTGLANPLSGGQTVQLTLTFAQAGVITLGVPVEPHAYDYATFSPPPVIPKPTVSAKPRAKATGSASASASASGSASASASASPSTTP